MEPYPPNRALRQERKCIFHFFFSSEVELGQKPSRSLTYNSEKSLKRMTSWKLCEMSV